MNKIATFKKLEAGLSAMQDLIEELVDDARSLGLDELAGQLEEIDGDLSGMKLEDAA